MSGSTPCPCPGRLRTWMPIGPLALHGAKVPDGSLSSCRKESRVVTAGGRPTGPLHRRGMPSGCADWPIHRRSPSPVEPGDGRRRGHGGRRQRPLTMGHRPLDLVRTAYGAADRVMLPLASDRPAAGCCSAVLAGAGVRGVRPRRHANPPLSKTVGGVWCPRGDTLHAHTAAGRAERWVIATPVHVRPVGDAHDAAASWPPATVGRRRLQSAGSPADHEAVRAGRREAEERGISSAGPPQLSAAADRSRARGQSGGS